MLRIVLISLCCLSGALFSQDMERVRVSPDGTHFVLEKSGKAFVPVGFNYDRDDKGRLIEDYWESEWSKVEKDFRAMKELGASVVRVHIQFAKFMEAPGRANAKSLERLGALLLLAEQTRLYLDLTGLGCYHKKDVPEWYAQMDESERWKAQASFWNAVATTCAKSPAIFCYDLMNEPVSLGKPREAGDWLAPPMGDESFVQFISLEPRGRSRAQIALAWVKALAAAIRTTDNGHPITVGLLPGTVDRGDAWSGFDLKVLANELDFVSVHIYPEKGRVGDAVKILSKFSIGKPIVIEETFPLRCSIVELEEFIDLSRDVAAGWIGFFWGKTPNDLRGSKAAGDILELAWLELFQRKLREKK